VGGGRCVGQLLDGGNSPRWRSTSEGGGEGGTSGFDGGRGAPAAPRRAYDARRERGVRMNRLAEEETWVRVWLTGGRGGGGVSGQIPW
jgi:hypothetical protein